VGGEDEKGGGVAIPTEGKNWGERKEGRISDTFALSRSEEKRDMPNDQGRGQGGVSGRGLENLALVSGGVEW